MVSLDAKQAKKQSQKPYTQPGVMGHPIHLKIYRPGRPPVYRALFHIACFMIVLRRAVQIALVLLS